MVSNIGDGWTNAFPDKWPHFNPPPIIVPPEVSRAEFEALRKEIKELKKLLEAAKQFDKETGQPDCEMNEKVEMIKKIARLVGVNLGDVFDVKQSP